MSQALSNFSLLLPMSSVRSTKSFPINGGGFSLKAMANDARDNLDHLQRVRKQQQQTQPKKRVVAPAPPVGNQSLPKFPASKFQTFFDKWLMFEVSILQDCGIDFQLRGRFNRWWRPWRGWWTTRLPIRVNPAGGPRRCLARRAGTAGEGHHGRSRKVRQTTRWGLTCPEWPNRTSRFGWRRKC